MLKNSSYSIVKMHFDQKDYRAQWKWEFFLLFIFQWTINEFLKSHINNAKIKKTRNGDFYCQPLVCYWLLLSINQVLLIIKKKILRKFMEYTKVWPSYYFYFSWRGVRAVVHVLSTNTVNCLFLLILVKIRRIYLQLKM